MKSLRRCGSVCSAPYCGTLYAVYRFLQDRLGDTSASEYRPFAVGPVDLNDALKVWVGSPGSMEVQYVWIDRLTLTRE